MYDFRQYLKMGGNVVLGDQAAERIDLQTVERSKIVPVLFSSLKIINQKFRKDTGLELWSEALLDSKKFLSGSAFHFFNTQKIGDDEFKSVKKSVGDLDTKVPEDLAPFIRTWLTDRKPGTCGDLTFVGFKESVGQFITLWASKTLNQNIQIDLEQLPFVDGVPTEWAEFSHSSEWVDLSQGVKGVAHKNLLRALNAKDLNKVLIRMKSGKEKVVTSAELAFSASGARQKLEPIRTADGTQEIKNNLPVYREVPTSESGFNTDLADIFLLYFGHDPSATELKQMWSFTGMLQLIKTHFTKQQQLKIADGFANNLWGPGQQKLYRDNPDQDLEEKTMMVQVMCKALGISSDRWDAMKKEYYK